MWKIIRKISTFKINNKCLNLKIISILPTCLPQLILNSLRLVSLSDYTKDRIVNLKPARISVLVIPKIECLAANSITATARKALLIA